MTERIPAEVFPIGELMAEELVERGWTVVRLAELTGCPLERLQAILSGGRRLDIQTAEALGRTLGTSAEMWMNLDMYYRRYRRTVEAR